MDDLFDAGDARKAEAAGEGSAAGPTPAAPTGKSIFPSWNEADEEAFASLGRRRAMSKGSAAAPPHEHKYQAKRRSRSRSRSHSRGVSEDTRAAAAAAAATGVVDFPTNEDEVEGYLPPMNGPSRRNRQRFDSVGSWGSSVMPAALPVRQAAGGYASHRKAAKQQEVLRHQQQASSSSSSRRDPPPQPPPAGRPTAGLQDWLESTTRLAVPQTDAQNRATSSSSKLAPPSPQQHPHPHGFASFAPSGRVRRVDSDVASNGPGGGGAGSIGGWSTGVKSASGRRQKRQRERSSGAAGSSRNLNALLGGGVGGGGGDDVGSANANSALDSVLEWRAGLGDGDGESGEKQLHPPLTPRRRHRSTTPAASVAAAADPSLSSLPPPPPRPSDTPLRTFVRGMMKEGLNARTIVALSLFLAAIAKWAVGSASVASWETSRHWMALTTNLPTDEWYTFDVAHRLLDRPPLAAMWAALVGRIAGSGLFPRLVGELKFPPSPSPPSPSLLHTYQVAMHIVVVDLSYLVPTLLFVSRRLQDRGRRTKAIASATMILQPALLLAEYGLGEMRGMGLGACSACLALFYTSIPNVDGDAEAEADVVDGGGGGGGGSRRNSPRHASSTTSPRHSRITSLSRKVSTSYVLATAAFVTGTMLDQHAALFLAPVVAALLTGRLVGLATGVSLTRGVAFANWVVGVAVAAAAVPLLPWLLPLLSLRGGVREAGLSSLKDVWARVSVSPAFHAFPLSSSLPLTSAHRWILTALVSAWPLFILLRAARETVLLENYLASGGAETKKGKSRNASDNANTTKNASENINSTTTNVNTNQDRPTLNAPPTPSSTRSRSRNPRHSAAAAVAAPASEAGSDLRSLAESIVGIEGGESVHKGHTATAIALPRVSSSCPSPSAAVLPYVASSVSLAIWLFSPVAVATDTTTSAVLYPLLPLTLLLSSKGDPWGGGSSANDWEWAMLANNVGVFSLWAGVREAGLAIPYLVAVLAWNWLVGYRPLRRSGASTSTPTSASPTFARYVHYAMLAVHAISLLDAIVGGGQQQPLAAISAPISIATLVSAVSTAAMLGVWVWSVKRVAEVAVGNGLALGAMG